MLFTLCIIVTRVVGGDVDIRESLFLNVSSKSSGGAVFTDGGALTLLHNMFAMCRSTSGEGGGVYTVNSKAELHRNCFHTCIALTSDAYFVSYVYGNLNFTTVTGTKNGLGRVAQYCYSDTRTTNMNNTDQVKDNRGAFDYYKDTYAFIQFSQFFDITDISGPSIDLATGSVKSIAERCNFKNMRSGNHLFWIGNTLMTECWIVNCTYKTLWHGDTSTITFTDCYSDIKLSKPGCKLVSSAVTPNPVDVSLCYVPTSQFSAPPAHPVWSLIRMLILE